MYEVTLSLCKDFPSLNPFIIRETDAEEVFSLLKRRKYYLKNYSVKKQDSNRRKIDPRNATWL